MGGPHEAEGQVEGVHVSFERMLDRFKAGGLRPRGYESYYEATQRQRALGISLPPKARLLELQPPFAKLSVDVLTEVLVPDGFRTGDDLHEGVLRLIDRVWQANDMDTQFTLAAAEALAAGAAFWVLAPPDDDVDGVSVRAFGPANAGVRVDQRGEVVEGIAVYRVPGGVGATYYTREGVEFWERSRSGRWLDTGRGRKDPWGASIIPMFNKARLGDRYGRSDLKDLVGLIDAASRTLTNLQIAQEVAAMPLRVLIGDGADEMLAQFPDRMQAYIGALLAAPTGADLKQVGGADLTPFLNTYKLYALQVSAATGIPPAMIGVAADSNPTSAEALRVAKDRLISRAENKQRQFGDALERVGRLIVAMSGEATDGLERLEVTWRDAAAPSASAQLAAALQAQAQGVVSSRTVRDMMRLTPEQARRENGLSSSLQDMSGQPGSTARTVLDAYQAAIAGMENQSA